MELSDEGLFRAQAFVGGRFVSAADGSSYPVFDPANLERLAEVARCTEVEAEQAIEAAAAAGPAWRATLAHERAALLRAIAASMLEHAGDLATILTRESGKPLTEALSEISYARSFFEHYADQAAQILGEVIPPHRQGARLLVLREPIGVTAAITPWNFPAAMIARKLAPALAAGCTMVIKPAEGTPLTALALAEICARVRVPAGVVNVITGDRSEADRIGRALTSSPLVRKLSFTGSTAVGKQLYAQCAGTVKRLSLELGGNAPFLVFDDADLDAALDGLMVAKFRNSGQTCVAANRILVQRGVMGAFRDRLEARIASLRVAPGLEEGSQIGPLIDARALEKVGRHVEEACEAGATLRLGGHPHALGGRFFAPTLLEGVTPEMRIAREEIFGPVAALMPFETEEEGIRLANDTQAGLVAYFYARDIGRVFRVSEALEAGMVGANTGLVSTAVAPFGGIKQSGLGREGSRHGLEEWLELKYVSLGL